MPLNTPFDLAGHISFINTSFLYLSNQLYYIIIIILCDYVSYLHNLWREFWDEMLYVCGVYKNYTESTNAIHEPYKRSSKFQLSNLTNGVMHSQLFEPAD